MLKGMIYLAGAMGPWVGGWDEWRYVKPFFYDAGASYDADQASLVAGDLDSEVKMAKTSKEAKGDRPVDTLPRKKRGSTRWEDPW